MLIPKENLLKYSSYELRQAANWIDRENKQYPLLNVLSMMQKLDSLGAELTVSTGEKGYITFWLPEKQAIVTRRFSSASELSTALSLGPIDIQWYGNLFIKTSQGNMPIEPIGLNEDKNQLIIKNLVTKSNRYIWLNGAEKILANSPDGRTAGQIKLGDKSINEVNGYE